MGWVEKQGGNRIAITKTVGAELEGTFVGNEKIPAKKPGEFQNLWKFENENGPFSIYGFTSLDMAMSSVKEASLCKIKYLGKKLVKTKSFGEMMVHQCSVAVWDDGTAKESGVENAKSVLGAEEEDVFP